MKRYALDGEIADGWVWILEAFTIEGHKLGDVRFWKLPASIVKELDAGVTSEVAVGLELFELAKDNAGSIVQLVFDQEVSAATGISA